MGQPDRPLAAFVLNRSAQRLEVSATWVRQGSHRCTVPVTVESVRNEEYVERVLSLVELVPAGRVTTYGAIARAVGSGGPRQVGQVMSQYGGPVPWWRVVRADGRPPMCQRGEARRHHALEGTPMRGSGTVDMAAAMWWPTEHAAGGSDTVGDL